MRIAPATTRRDRTPFFGRQRELSHLHDAVTGGAELITLTGPSGIGKTRLALQVASGLARRFEGEGGVWFARLAECRDASDLRAAVARVLDIQHHEEDLARSIANRGPLLLILDNADPIASICGPIFEGWLERCVELQIIVTSLVPLEIPGETLFEIRPLDIEDAVAIYVDRASRAWADRSFTSDESSQIQELVSRLDRHPLAIELAAARVRILPPRTLLSMLERRFDLLRATPPLRGGGAGGVPRRSSLVGALDITWAHLEPREQIALARIAVFEGDFTAAAASAIVEDHPTGVQAAPGSDPHGFEVLESLHRKSLLVCEGSDLPRYALLEGVKAYALHQLRLLERWDETIRRHADFYVRQIRIRPLWHQDPEEANPIHWLRDEHKNLLVIVRRFLDTEPSLAAKAGIALAPLVLFQGPLTSESEFIAMTLEGARRSGDTTLLLAALDPISTMHFRAGRIEESKAATQEAIDLASSRGDVAAEAFALSRLATTFVARSELDLARAPLDRAIALSRELGASRVEGQISFVLGLGALKRGMSAEAEAHLLRAVELLQNRELHDSATSLFTLGLAYANQQLFDKAHQVIREAIEIGRRTGDRYLEAGFLLNLGKLMLGAGHLAEAEETGQRAIAILRELGNGFREGLGVGILGIVAFERGDLHAAADRLSQADEILSDYSEVGARSEFLIFHAILEARTGQPDEARRMLERARTSAVQGANGLSAVLSDGAQVLIDAAAARRRDPLDRGEITKTLADARSRLAGRDLTKVGWPSLLWVLRRLVEKEIDEWGAGPPSPPRQAPGRTLITDADGSWFQLTGEHRVDLSHRPILLRIFKTLLQARLAMPGVAVDPYEIIEAVWPRAKMPQGRETKRLYMAIWTLREIGMRSAILHREDGYLLDPNTPIREEAGS